MSGRSSPASKQRWEQRFRGTGARMVGVRLSPAAAEVLASLRMGHDCSDRDVIEGLLLGTVAVPKMQSRVATAMREYGFNLDEAIVIVENGWDKT